MKIMSLVFMILGCFLGAGFVSGREIASYFSSFGKFSILAIIIASILLFLLIYLFLWLSNRTNTFYKFITYYFGKFGFVINILFAICLFILISSMFAGSLSIAYTLGINQLLIAGITLIISYFSVIGSEKIISKINMIIIPSILIIMLIICGVDFKVQSIDSNCLWAIFSSINYVLINIVTLGLYILQIGHKYSSKEKLLSALISSIIVCFFMLISNSAIISNNLLDSSLPILSLAQMKGNILSIVTAIVIWCGLFTTIISCVYLLAKYITHYLKNYKLSILLILSGALLCSNFGFDFMVNYIYSIIGVIGLILVLSVARKEKEIFITKISNKF